MTCAMDETGSYEYYEDVNWGLLRLWGKRTGLRVLDVGCGFANTSEAICKLGNEVTGIELDEHAASVAATRVTRVVRADVQAFGDIERQLGDSKFDVIMFADVLEHLAWPIGVLRGYLRWLAPEGSVIVSLPNVGLWSVRFSLLFGTFDYADTGVLDRTHLRFFTRKTARHLLDAAGLEPVRVQYNPGLVRPLVPLAKKMMGSGGDGPHDPAALLNSRPYKLYLRMIYPLELAISRLVPGLLAFQHIFEAKRKNTKP